MAFPEWLEKYRISDAALAESYESTPAAWRGALKTGIAISHFYYGTADSHDSHLREANRLSLGVHTSAKPVNWALLIIGDDVKAAARICALAILPRLAGVEEVFAVIVGQPERQALVTLELCGIEDLFAADAVTCAELLHSTASACGPFGRICFLHEGKLQSLIQSEQLSGNYVNLAERPKLLLAKPEAFARPCLEFCQGQTIETNANARTAWDAVFSTESLQNPGFISRLHLAPGCEGFWVFAHLTPVFFLEKSISVKLGNMAT